MFTLDSGSVVYWIVDAPRRRVLARCVAHELSDTRHVLQRCYCTVREPRRTASIPAL